MAAIDGEGGLRVSQTAAIDPLLLDLLRPKLHGLDAMRDRKAEEKT